MRAVGNRLAGGHRHLLPHLGIWVQTGALRSDLQSRNSRIKRVQIISTLKAELFFYILAQSNISNIHREKNKQKKTM